MEQVLFERRVEELTATTTSKALRDAAIELLRNVGFSRWIYATENPHGALGFPATLANEFGKWMVEYLAKGYMKVDPVLKHCRDSTEPYFWDAGAEVQEASGKLQAMMCDLAANGFHSGMAIGLRHPDGIPGLLHVTSELPLVESRAQFEEALSRLVQTGKAMHIAMARILKENANVKSA